MTANKEEISKENNQNTSPRPYGKQKYLILAGILLLTILVYSNSIHYQFLSYDDNFNITQNQDIRDMSARNVKKIFSSTYVSMYVPLTMLTYMIDYKISGLNPKVFHITSLILHLLMIVCVFHLLLIFTSRMEIATFSALFFAIHPMNIEPVLWLSSRGTLLYSFFYLVSLIFYTQYVKKHFQIRYWTLAFIFFILSLLSKLAAMTLPLILLLLDYFLERKWDRKIIYDKIPFFILSVAAGIAAIATRGSLENLAKTSYSILHNFFISCYALDYYLFKFILPINLSSYNELPHLVNGFLPIEYYLSPLPIFAIIGLIYIWRKFSKPAASNFKIIVFGFLLFLIPNFIVMLRIVPFSNQVVAERYIYIPYIGLFFLIGYFYVYLVGKKSAYAKKIKFLAMIFFCLIAVLFSFQSYQRIGVWKNGITFWNDVIKKNPDLAFAYYHRAGSKTEFKDINGAIADYSRAIEIYPGYADALVNRGILKYEQGDNNGAIDDFNGALKIYPNFADALYNIGNIKLRLKDYAGAIIHYNKTLEVAPGFALAYFNRGVAKYQSGNAAGACSDWRTYQQFGNHEMDFGIMIRCMNVK